MQLKEVIYRYLPAVIQGFHTHFLSYNPELEELGWTAITVWECQLKRDRVDETMERVIEQVRAARPGR